MNYSEGATTGFLSEFHGSGKGPRLLLSFQPVGGEKWAIGYALDYDQQVTKDIIMSKTKFLARCIARNLEVKGFLG